MSTNILLIRHGETAWNRGQIFRGVHDVPLNENGRDQARQLAHAAAWRKIDAAYTSPLSRAVETAELVLDPHHIEATVHAGLIDFDYGDWTGIQAEQVAVKWPEAFAQWNSTPQELRVPGGDKLAEVFDKASACLKQIVEQHAGQTVALFAHRVVNKLLALHVLGLGMERFGLIRQDNCCLNHFEWTEHGYVIVCLNDTCHLRQAGTPVLDVDF
jgi:broad specificity phosphatase PhoE